MCGDTSIRKADRLIWYRPTSNVSPVSGIEVMGVSLSGTGILNGSPLDCSMSSGVKLASKMDNPEMETSSASQKPFNSYNAKGSMGYALLQWSMKSMCTVRIVAKRITHQWLFRRCANPNTIGWKFPYARSSSLLRQSEV